MVFIKTHLSFTKDKYEFNVLFSQAHVSFPTQALKEFARAQNWNKLASIFLTKCYNRYCI